MEEPQRNMAKYFLSEIEKNKIAEKGCRYISKAKWKPLELIDLGHFPEGENKIGDRGCQHICRGDWPQIRVVYTGNYFQIQDGCFIREAGCRSMTKFNRQFEYIGCYLCQN